MSVFLYFQISRLWLNRFSSMGCLWAKRCFKPHYMLSDTNVVKKKKKDTKSLLALMIWTSFKASTNLDVSSQWTHNKQFKGPIACWLFLLNPVKQTTGVCSKHHFLEKQTIFVIYYIPDQSRGCSKSPFQYKQTHWANEWGCPDFVAVLFQKQITNVFTLLNC